MTAPERGAVLAVHECFSCHYTTRCTVFEMNGQRHFRDGKRALAPLCWLCANTAAGNAYQYPEQHPNKATLETVCFVGNLLLDGVGSGLTGSGLIDAISRREKSDYPEYDWEGAGA